jgi:GAF domain-containing protein
MTHATNAALGVFERIGDAFNSPIQTEELLDLVVRTVAEHLHLKGCHIHLLSRDRTLLENVASWGLSRAFLEKGPLRADRSVAETLQGRSVMVSDCATDPRIQYPEAFRSEGIASLLSVPLTTRGQVIGVMRLSLAERREFTGEELATIRAVASFCSSAILHAMFHQILAHVGETIRATLELDAMLPAIARVVAEDLRARGCTIRLRDGKAGALRLRGSFGLSDPYLQRTATAEGHALTSALAGDCVALLDAATDPRMPGAAEASAEGIGSCLFVPLALREGVIGVLTLCTNSRYEFSDEELRLMKTIGEECALAIRNAQMYAAMKNRYQDLVEDFHRWFEYNTYSPGGTLPV